MKSRLSLTVLLVVALSPLAPMYAEDASAPVPAAPAGGDAAPATAPAKKTGIDGNFTLKQEFKQMDSDLKLGDEEKAKVLAAYNAKADAIAEWDTKNKAKYEKSKRLYPNMKSGNDKETMKSDIEYMEDEKKEMEKKSTTEILAALTPAQKDTWTSLSLSRHATRFYGRFTLTPDQKKLIQDQVDKSAKGLDITDEKTFRLASKEVRTFAEHTVFTEQQKDTWRKAKANNRAIQEDNSDEPDPAPEDTQPAEKKTDPNVKVENTKPKSGFLDQAQADKNKAKAAPVKPAPPAKGAKPAPGTPLKK